MKESPKMLGNWWLLWRHYFIHRNKVLKKLKFRSFIFISKINLSISTAAFRSNGFINSDCKYNFSQGCPKLNLYYTLSAVLVVSPKAWYWAPLLFKLNASISKCIYSNWTSTFIIYLPLNIKLLNLNFSRWLPTMPLNNNYSPLYKVPADCSKKHDMTDSRILGKD